MDWTVSWVVSFLILCYLSLAIDGHQRVELSKVNVITLSKDQMTTGRRNSPIQQLKCIGGSAGCYHYIPEVVQCYNRGSDGFDVQWECKTDMDYMYRFGKTIVSCEGYEYPDDPYVLKGSCGMEYTLELTKSGHSSNNHHYEGNSYRTASKLSNKSSWTSDIIMFIVVAIIVYALYASCIGNIGTQSDPAADFGDHRNGRPPPSAPPPPGFRSMPHNNDDDNYDSCGGTSYRSNTHTRHNTQNPFGGFWGGAATGGMLGYLFGSRTNTQYHQPHYRQPYNTGWGSFFGSGSSNNYHSGSSFSSGSSNSGSRSTSGFGGTRRR